MEDLQSQPDKRRIAIDRVGINNLRYPVVIVDDKKGKQATTATISMSVNLPQHVKGTHMSRFIEILNRYHNELKQEAILEILHVMKEKLEAETAHIGLHFPYFLERKAPVSGATGLVDYECLYSGKSNETTDELIVGVKVPVTSLCPCSKAISDYGAHNQRGDITIRVKPCQQKDGQIERIGFETLIDIAESSASSQLYALLKREDERHVTMQAYDNPVFVEDMLRNVASKLQEEPNISWFHVSAVNHESIHNHAAFAEVEWKRTDFF